MTPKDIGKMTIEEFEAVAHRLARASNEYRSALALVGVSSPIPSAPAIALERFPPGALCAVEACQVPRTSKGFCRNHYMKFRDMRQRGDSARHGWSENAGPNSLPNPVLPRGMAAAKLEVARLEKELEEAKAQHAAKGAESEAMTPRQRAQRELLEQLRPEREAKMGQFAHDGGSDKDAQVTSEPLETLSEPT